MGNVVVTANSHQTSLLVSDHIPEFIQSEHPTFVTFIEKYYEFLANNSLITTATDSSTYYYGVDSATKIIPDLGDIDTTDLDNFTRSFNAQYGKFLPEKFKSSANRRNFQKNILDFYRSVGTADSFKYLFRLLFNEEIDIRLPIDEILIASGGEYQRESYLMVPYIEGLEDMAEREIIGVTSGASAMVNEVHVIPTDQTMSFKPGRHANSHIPRMLANNVTRDIEHVMEPEFLRIHQPKKAFLVLDQNTLDGQFQLHEKIYTRGSEKSVNSVVLPLATTNLMNDNYSYPDSDNMFSPFDNYIDRNFGTNISYNIKPGNILRQSESSSSVGIDHLLPKSANSFSSSNVGLLFDFTNQKVGNTRPHGFVPQHSSHKIVSTGGTDSINVLEQLVDRESSAGTYIDPYSYSLNLEDRGLGFSTEYSTVSLCMRQTVDAVYDEEDTSPQIQLFWANNSVNFGSRRASVYMKRYNTDPTRMKMGKWHVYRYDLADRPAWKHAELETHQIIDRIRYDIGGAWRTNNLLRNPKYRNAIGDTYQIAWIRFDNPGVEFTPEVAVSDIGPWYTANGAGQMRLIGGPGTDTVDAAGKILVVGDTLSFNDDNEENRYYREKNQTERFLVWNQKIPFDERNIYKMSVRAKGLDGKSGYEESANSGSLFSAGVITYASNGVQFFTDISNNYVDISTGETKAISLVANSVPLDDSFFTYSAYFSGRQLASEIDTYDPSLGTSIVTQTNPYRAAANNYGSGGRLDLPGRFPTTGSVTNPTKSTSGISHALAGNARLPYFTSFFSPFIRVNQTLKPSVNSLARTVIDSVKVEVVEPMHFSEGRYVSQRSLLSTPGAKLRGHNLNEYSYEIVSEQDSTNYYTIVKDSVNPAGLKMLASKTSPRSPANTKLSIHQSPANNSIYSNTNIENLWTPHFDTSDSLAGWWKGDSIVPANLDRKKSHPELPVPEPVEHSYGKSGVINYWPYGISEYENQKDYISERSFRYEDQAIYAPQNGSDTANKVNQISVGLVHRLVRGDSPTGGNFYTEWTQANNSIASTPGGNYWHPTLLANSGSGSVGHPSGGNFALGRYKNVDLEEERHQVILEPYKKWLVSVYARTNNVTPASGTSGGITFSLTGANTSGSMHTPTKTVRFSAFEQNNVWERKSVVLDLSTSPLTRFDTISRFEDHSDRPLTLATGNNVYSYDGWMIEEYNPPVHGIFNIASLADGNIPYTPSPYKRPYATTYANVHSWYDLSPNEHHVYANTHGIYLYPQYVANGINGYPVVRFRSNTVKSTANSDMVGNHLYSAGSAAFDGNNYMMFNQNYNNVYAFSTLGGGTANALGMFHADRAGYKRSMATTTLQSRMLYDANGVNIGGSLAVPILPRPVANQWTMISVAKLNLPMNSIFYGRHDPGTDSSYRSDGAIFASGYSGVSGETRSSGGHTIGTDAGNMDLRIRQQDNDDVNGQGVLQTLVRGNTTHSGFYQAGYYAGLLANQFNIYTTSEFAGNTYLSPYTGNSSFDFPGYPSAQSANSDIITFFYNGRRYGSAGGSVLNQMATWGGFDANTNNTLNDGMVWYEQNNYVTSIGGVATSNNDILNTGNAGINRRFKHHSSIWDGDIAEILVFNKKMSNNEIATMEGYLAHKYGIQDRLVWKDAASAGVATEFSSAGVHHPFRFDPPKIGYNPFDSNTYYSNY